MPDIAAESLSRLLNLTARLLGASRFPFQLEFKILCDIISGQI